jgi:hypothetical protein
MKRYLEFEIDGGLAVMIARTELAIGSEALKLPQRYV